MAIRDQKPEPPRSLPAVRLYLDAIEEAARILLAATKEHEPDPSGQAPHVTFLVRGKECDSVEDLKRLGGTTCELKILVRRRPEFGNSLTLRRYGSTWQVSGPDEIQWKAHGSLLALFERNRIWWKSALSVFPGWALWILAQLVLLSGFLVPFLALKSHRPLGIALAAVLASIVLFGWYKYLFQHSIIVLHYSYEKTRLGDHVKSGGASFSQR